MGQVTHLSVLGGHRRSSSSRCLRPICGVRALAVTVVSRVLTGSYLPCLTGTPLLALAISVLALSGLSSVGPTAMIPAPGVPSVSLACLVASEPVACHSGA